MTLPQCLRRPPSLTVTHLNHQQSPARKLPRDTLVVSSSVGMFSCFRLPQFQILPDKGLLYHWRRVMPCKFTLQRTLFKSRNCKATICSNLSSSPKGEPAAPQNCCSCLLLFFFGGWILGCCGPALALNTASGPLRLMMWSNLWLNSGAKGRGQKENFINHPRNPLAGAHFLFFFFFTSQSLRSLATPSGRLKIMVIFFLQKRNVYFKMFHFQILVEFKNYRAGRTINATWPNRLVLQEAQVQGGKGGC